MASFPIQPLTSSEIPDIESLLEAWFINTDVAHYPMGHYDKGIMLMPAKKLIKCFPHIDFTCVGHPGILNPSKYFRKPMLAFSDEGTSRPLLLLV